MSHGGGLLGFEDLTTTLICVNVYTNEIRGVVVTPLRARSGALPASIRFYLTVRQ
jgi:hypothetical protein